MASMLLSATLKPTFPKKWKVWGFFRYGIEGCAIEPKLNTSVLCSGNLKKFCYLKLFAPGSEFNFIYQNAESANLLPKNWWDISIDLTSCYLNLTVPINLARSILLQIGLVDEARSPEVPENFCFLLLALEAEHRLSGLVTSRWLISCLRPIIYSFREQAQVQTDWDWHRTKSFGICADSFINNLTDFINFCKVSKFYLIFRSRTQPEHKRGSDLRNPVSTKFCVYWREIW